MAISGPSAAKMSANDEWVTNQMSPDATTGAVAAMTGNGDGGERTGRDGSVIASSAGAGTLMVPEQHSRGERITQGPKLRRENYSRVGVKERLSPGDENFVQDDGADVVPAAILEGRIDE